MLRIRRFDRGDTLLQQTLAGAAITLKRELYVLRRDGITVMEGGALAQDELMVKAVLRRQVRLGEARRLLVVRHRLHQSVVQSVQEHVGRDDFGGLPWVEPGGRERHMHAVGQLRRRAGNSMLSTGGDAEGGEGEQRSSGQQRGGTGSSDQPAAWMSSSCPP